MNAAQINFELIFNARKAAILVLSSQWIHTCILPLNAAMSWTHLKRFHLFPAWRCLAGLIT